MFELKKMSREGIRRALGKGRYDAGVGYGHCSFLLSPGSRLPEQLPCARPHLVEHRFGQLAGESVLLAGVIGGK